MFYVSEIKTDSPKDYKNVLQFLTYKTLEELHVPYERVDTDEAITMADCDIIDRKLDMEMVKTLFLCNRQQTKFFLFITKGSKRFDAKAFSKTLGIPRVSFAPEDRMNDMLGTKIGAATVFSALMDSADDVRVIFDKEVTDQDFYGCSDGTTTGYMKIRTDQILNTVLPYTKHTAEIIEV